MSASFAPRRRVFGVGAQVCCSWLIGVAATTSTWAQNPFAPAPKPPAPAAPAPAAPGGAPAAGTTPAAPAPAANPFAVPPAAPVATAPKPAMPAPAANPFATPTPSATPGTALPAVPGAAPPTSTGAALNLPAVLVGGPAPSGGYRVLAPGVLTTIPSPVGPADRFSYHDVVEVLAEDPAYGERPTAPGKSDVKNVHFVHDVWGLDFAFKPVRFLRLPGPNGTTRLVWYMVYTVRNGPVKAYKREETPPHAMVAIPVDKPFLFVPRFELESHDVKQTYMEKIIPEAVAAVRQREDKNRPLLNTLEMTGEIPPSTPELDRTVWGVVTWEGVDPRTDRFSIYVQGLTNVYRWKDDGTHQKGDPVGKGRTYQYQVLKLNFWRPSDELFAHEGEIRFGIPGAPDYEWLDRP